MKYLTKNRHSHLFPLLLSVIALSLVATANAFAIQDDDKIQHGDFGAGLCPDVFETVGVPADQLGLGLPFHWCTHFATPMPPGVSDWYTLTNSVDLVNGPATGNGLMANTGENFVDIIGSPGFGALNQNIETVAGRSYIVDFYVSSNQGATPGGPNLQQFNYFWNGVAELTSTEAPVQNTYDRFTFIHEATQPVTQIGWGAVNTPGSLDNNGVPFFGVMLDTVSAIEIRPNNDVTKLDENFPFSSFRLDVLANDSGIDRVVGAAVVGCSANLTMAQCGSIIQDGFPGGQVFWDGPGGDPLAYDFLAEGETATISVDYATETSRNTGRNGTGQNVTVNDTGRWTITITGTNDPPVANPDDIQVNEDDSVTFDLFANDDDVDGILSLDFASQPSNGTLVNNGGGNFEYTPNPDFCGTDAFFYRVEDDNGAVSEIVIVSIEIVPDPIEPADSFQRFRGIFVGGDIEDAQSSDDLFLTHRPGFTLNSEESPIWLEFEGTLSKASPSQLSFAIESRSTTPNISQILELFNFDTGQFEVVDTRNATTNDSVTTVAATGDLNRFVSAGDVRARTGWIQAGFILAFPWEIRIDQVIWIED